MYVQQHLRSIINIATFFRLTFRRVLQAWKTEIRAYTLDLQCGVLWTTVDRTWMYEQSSWPRFSRNASFNVFFLLGEEILNTLLARDVVDILH